MAVETQNPFILPDKFETLDISKYEKSETMSIPSTPSTPTSPPPEPYEILPVTSEDSERVLNHLRKFFFKDEPLNVAVKLIEPGETSCKELEEFSMNCVKDNLSLMAVTSSGTVIGVSLNEKMERNDEPCKDIECPNPKFRKILNLLCTIDSEGKVFEKFPNIDKILNVTILSVDETWRGKGIAKQLMNKTREMAKEQGFGLMRVDCTSYYSAKAVIRLGFRSIYTLKYEDHKVNGEPVFTPEDPHTEAKIYVQEI